MSALKTVGEIISNPKAGLFKSNNDKISNNSIREPAQAHNIGFKEDQNFGVLLSRTDLIEGLGLEKNLAKADKKSIKKIASALTIQAQKIMSFIDAAINILDTKKEDGFYEPISLSNPELSLEKNEFNDNKEYRVKNSDGEVIQILASGEDLKSIGFAKVDSDKSKTNTAIKFTYKENEELDLLEVF